MENGVMEMHQIRYFLAVARTLNFTRAAEECHVAQPSLTRAIKLLEGEFGGELFRRERNLSHLTDLGNRMLPLMQQCYESAASAKSLATAVKTGSVAPLQLGLSRTISIELLIPALSELTRTFKGLEMKFMRGSGPEVTEALKKGDVELAIAGPLGETWDRFDTWPLFTEQMSIVVNEGHHLSGRNGVDVDELKGEKLLLRPYCEQYEQFAGLLRSMGIVGNTNHQVATDNDVMGLLGANVGIALLPNSAALPKDVRRLHVNGMGINRTVHAYGVAGRPRSTVASTFLKQLRAADWSRYAAAA